MPTGIATLGARAPDNMKPSATTPIDQYVIGLSDTHSVFAYCNADLSEAGTFVRPEGRISVLPGDTLIIPRSWFRRAAVP